MTIGTLELEQRLLKAWCKESSHSPKTWTPENPAWGQCAATALVVKALLGGHVMRCVATLPDGRDIVHYCNRLPSGFSYDFTVRQFPEGTDYGHVKRHTPRGKSVTRRADLLMKRLNLGG